MESVQLLAILKRRGDLSLVLGGQDEQLDNNKIEQGDHWCPNVD